jgi:hypothetical protein
MFAPAGIVDSTTAGTVSKTFIPLNADQDAGAVNIWCPMGIISAIKESTKAGASVTTFRPTPGTLQADNLLESKFTRTLDMTIEECSNLMWLAMRRALAPSSIRQSGTAIGQFVPFTGGTVRGWLKLQMYNQDTNTQEVAEQTWGALQIDGTSYGDDKNAKFEAKFTQLFSTLNTHTAI